MNPAPSVSVVTPFFNTREFLAECIESVLHQTYQDWEYVLVDNCSTDGSGEVAAHYASRFPEKIRLVRTESFLSQVQNYNYALSCISPKSKFCKVVQADDWLFPDCIRSMVEVAEVHPQVGVVAAYQLEGVYVALDGLPYPSLEVPGRDICRRHFLQNQYFFGTPTSLLLRSEIVRTRSPFYDERYAPFEDADACFDLLKTWNFGFVHQVLTYSRRDNDSILSKIRPFKFLYFARLAEVVAHGKDSLSAEEYEQCLKAVEKDYFLFLGRAALQLRSREFWDYHRKNLASLGYSLNARLLCQWVPRALLDCIANPKHTWDVLRARRRSAAMAE